MVDLEEVTLEQMLSEVQQVLDLSPRDILLHSEKECPEKVGYTHFPSQAYILVLVEAEITWLVMRHLLKDDDYNGVKQAAIGCMRRLCVLEKVFEVVGTAEKGSVAHLSQVIISNMEFILEDFSKKT